ncbi:MAG: hypothetical protein IJW08_01640 [Lentisphaeria bacterium]|nr:hypothetical protein [Lentisphaeria bacterium]MBQ7395222.1 hypothetical protein [Lentisphaeria bacterium]
MSSRQGLEYLSGFSGARVAVVGDVMLDVYLWGQVSRISPEAPVPVVSVDRRTSCLGGASNVMRNLRTLGAAAYAYGVVGDDEAGRELADNLKEFGVFDDGIIIDSSRRTTEKKRIVAGSQQLLRVDTEDTFEVDNSIRKRLVEKVISRIRAGELDAVIFEDYNKGLLSAWMLNEIICEAKKHGVITALDPKPGSLEPVKNLSVMKPNRVEAFALAGIADDGAMIDVRNNTLLHTVADKLLDIWEPELLLLSLASQGMALFRKGREVEVIPTRAREVFDVSGAGDTVTATYTVSAISGAPARIAAEIANRAAGIVVGKVGTAPIMFDELKKSFDTEE